MPRLRSSRIVPAAVGIFWGLLVMAGLGAVHFYDATAGPKGIRREQWPRESHLRPVAGRFNLVFAAHPRCPCTRASLDELAGIAERCRGTLAIHILCFRPAREPGRWGDTDLRRRAAGIPGVRLLDDPDGDEAARFGALTSGQTLLYDPAGRLRFHGGITAGRGRVGASAGRDAVVALVSGEPSSLTETRVFGCALRTPATSPGGDRVMP
jgi:hypothetical protein